MVNVAEALPPAASKAGAAGAGAGELPFAALGRLLAACASGWQERGQALQQPSLPCAPDGLPAACGASTLLELAEGPYLLVAACFDATTLCRVDATCRCLRELDRAQGGPWRQLGARAFYGLELDGDGAFDPAEGQPATGISYTSGGGRKLARVDWKGRYGRFLSEVLLFRLPFGSPDITEVQQPDEIAYSQCRVRTDLLLKEPEVAVYLEVEVRANPDNVSLAVVDFEDGGCSSVTFSPDTGAVIRERKVCESPRKVQGSYIQPLSTITAGQGFEGSLGLLLQAGHIAFFRRRADGEELGNWECTGFVTDLAWAEGKRLTPCLAFRNEGSYRVSTVALGGPPPLRPKRNAAAYAEAAWSSLDWDADQELMEAERS